MPIIQEVDDKSLIKVPFCVHGHRRKRTESGRIYCPTCNNKYIKSHKVEVGQHKKKWRELNRDKVRALWHRNKEGYKGKRADWEEKNKEIRRIKTKIYRENFHPLLYTWLGINYRCFFPTSTSFYNYGKRGITVHGPWKMTLGVRDKVVMEANSAAFKSFVNYIENNLGPRPEGTTLDRYPNHKGNYEPGNLRWATPKEQANNTRKSLTHRQNISDSETIRVGDTILTLKDISLSTGINLDVIKDRYCIYGNYNSIINQPRLIHCIYNYKGNFYGLYELAIISKLRYTTIKGRLRSSWTVEEAIEVPLSGKLSLSQE